MTPEERDLLSRFLDDLMRAKPEAKDGEAAQAIETSLRANPDAAYVLVQHAILADHALQDAQARIAELERQAEAGGAGQPPAPQPSSFLGNLFNKGAPPNPPGVGQTGPYGERGGSAVPPTGAPPAGANPSYFEPAPAQGQGPGYPAGAPGAYPQAGPFSGGGGLGGFLRAAAPAAAGVAGGAFLFEGLQGLFGGHRGGFGGGYGLGGGGFGGPAVENVTVNEYGDERGGGYDDDRPTYDSDDGDPGGDDYG